MSGLTALCLAKSEAHPYRDRGSKLTSAWFHHKFRLRQATRLSSPKSYGVTGAGQFISDREINAGSAFQFDSNLTLIELVLVIATVPDRPALVLVLKPNPLEQ
jgi:hypothetical protein